MCMKSCVLAGNIPEMANVITCPELKQILKTGTLYVESLQPHFPLCFASSDITLSPPPSATCSSCPPPTLCSRILLLQARHMEESIHKETTIV